MQYIINYNALSNNNWKIKSVKNVLAHFTEKSITFLFCVDGVPVCVWK